MKQEAIIQIAIDFQMLSICTLPHEDHTFDEPPVDEKHHPHIRRVATCMCRTIEYPTPEHRQLTIDRLTQYIIDTMAVHDRDDDAYAINEMCNIINRETT